jgi:hypothetical protein
LAMETSRRAMMLKKKRVSGCSTKAANSCESCGDGKVDDSKKKEKSRDSLDVPQKRKDRGQS